jgi:hypothetical protein
MAVNVYGIVINIVMIIVILIMVVLGLMFNTSLKNCETEQSPYCYTITCPCDDDTKGPCFGYATKPGSKEGTFRCSIAENTDVDITGKIV